MPVMAAGTPNYISAIFPLKDGVISDHTMTRELICRFVKQVYSSHMVKPRVAVCVPRSMPMSFCAIMKRSFLCSPVFYRKCPFGREIKSIYIVA